MRMLYNPETDLLGHLFSPYTRNAPKAVFRLSAESRKFVNTGGRNRNQPKLRPKLRPKFCVNQTRRLNKKRNFTIAKRCWLHTLVSYSAAGKYRSSLITFVINGKNE